MSRFYVEQQRWDRWPRTLVMVKKNDDGQKFKRDYVQIVHCCGCSHFDGEACVRFNMMVDAPSRMFCSWASEKI